MYVYMNIYPNLTATATGTHSVIGTYVYFSTLHIAYNKLGKPHSISED